jgi:DNA polymerase-3 subunit alpha
MVATINNYGGFYRTEFYVHEARMHGGNILPPCVNHSRGETVINGINIYLGLQFLHAIEAETIKKLTQERKKNGLYKSLDDFIERVGISVEQIVILIRINAFRFTGRNKRELLWEAHMKTRKEPAIEPQQLLFNSQKANYRTPSLPNNYLEDAFDQMELLGFPLCNPFELLCNPPLRKVSAAKLGNHIGEEVTLDGYLVCTKRTSTSGKKTMYFGTFLDEDGDFIDTVHFPPVAARYKFTGKGIYRITGLVVEEFGCLTVEVTSMERLAIIQDPRYAEGSVNTRMRGKRYKNVKSK